MKLNQLARGTYFRFDFRLFLLTDHHQELAETVELTRSGMFVRISRIREDMEVEIVGHNFKDVISYFEQNPGK